jgi:Fe-Mn family superoxide dismutase
MRFLPLEVRANIFSLPALPYDYDALEPHIDAETMRIHHGKHHAAYVAGLNAVADKLGDVAGNGDAVSVTALQQKALAHGMAARNHGGGHYNHALFWVNLKPAADAAELSAELMAAIEDKFINMDGLAEAFSKVAMGRFGSGWAWLGVKPDGSLAVTSTANQDNPLMEGLEYPVEKMIPILGLDVWEHAYYLKYQNKRADYVTAFWNVVNWKKVSRNYGEYAKLGKPVPPTPTGGGHATEL